MIYLDYNATTPCLPEVTEAMLPYFSLKYGNASSTTYPLAWQSDEAVTQARKNIAKFLKAEEQEIVFTSGATEACNLAIKGLYDLYRLSNKEKSFHIITTKTEHSAVLDTCSYLQQFGAEITYLDVDSKGRIDLQELEKSIQENTIMLAIMYANNETGVLQSMKEIGAIAKEKKIIFFSDCTQAAGKIDLNLKECNIGIAAFSAHKMYGPKGVGALYISRKDPRVRLIAQLNGGGQERGRRSGTLNVPAIVGFGIAADWQMKHQIANMEKIKSLRDELEKSLLEIPNSRINGNIDNRLDNTLNITFEDIKAEKLISKINPMMAISTGSACNAAEQKPAHVLKAMGLSEQQLNGSIRLSLGKDNTQKDIEDAVEIIKNAIDSIKKVN